MKRWLRILKLRFIRWCGFKLTGDEKSEICYWLTRNVTKSNEETLRELNSEVDEQEFIRSVRYGLIVQGKNGVILHFCGYANPITEVDKKHFYDELKTDVSFGLVDKIDDLVIVEAPQEVIDYYLKPPKKEEQ